jgi:DNA polymerase III delta prime subunit
MNFFELNASDESGIDTIRKKVKRWAKLKTLDSAVPFKIVFLDEADFLTMNSQTALRRIMEDHYSTCRFILACNYLHKIIQPLRSRSSIFHFQPLAEPDMVSYLRKIAKQEVRKGGRKLVKLSTVKGIVSRSGGDMRMALNFLEQALEGASFSTKTTGLLDMTWKEFLPVSYEQDATVLVEQLHAEALKRKSGRMIRRLAEADRDISRGATKVIQLQALFLDLKDMAERRRKR